VSRLSQYGGNAGSTRGYVGTADGWVVASGAGTIYAGTSVTFGATTANVYKDLVTFSGAGFLDMLTYVSGATTTRVVKIKVTIDGTVVITSTSGSIATGSNWGNTIVGCGGAPPTYAGSLRFNSSLVIAAQDNVGGTISQWISYIARTE